MPSWHCALICSLARGSLWNVPRACQPSNSLCAATFWRKLALVGCLEMRPKVRSTTLGRTSPPAETLNSKCTAKPTESRASERTSAALNYNDHDHDEPKGLAQPPPPPPPPLECVSFRAFSALGLFALYSPLARACRRANNRIAWACRRRELRPPRVGSGVREIDRQSELKAGARARKGEEGGGKGRGENISSRTRAAKFSDTKTRCRRCSSCCLRS